MSNYTQSTNFATKDSLPSGDPLKIVKGTEINTEFNNIAVAVATKADLASPTFTGNPALPTGAIGVTQSAGNNSAALATTAYADAAVAAVRLALYPVGSVYINANVTTNPATLLGFGTWVVFGAGRVMVGLDGSNADYDTLQETGGAYGHNHTMATAGAHSHTVNRDGWGTEGGFLGGVATGRLIVGSGQGESVEQLESLRSSGNAVPTDVVGTHSHALNGVDTVDPYIVVAMWRRTA